MTEPLDWRNRPYPPAPEAPTPDVSAAACRARAERAERRDRILGHIIVAVGCAVIAWWLDLSRVEMYLLVVMYLLVRILDAIEPRDTPASAT